MDSMYSSTSWTLPTDTPKSHWRRAFIELTADTGGAVWLRANTIESIYRDGSLTEIVTEEKPWYVQEFPEEIFLKLEESDRD